MSDKRLTLVTSLFDLARREPDVPRRTAEYYLEAGKWVCRLDQDMVIYCDPELAEPIAVIRAESGMAPRTKVVPVALEELDSYRLLDRAAKVLKDYPDVRIEIVGHTDSTGSREVNVDLSQRRAEAVKTYLVGKGIDASHYLVDLYLKLALPFSSLVLALIAIPIAGRLRRHPSIAAIIGVGTAVGFGYWVLLGLATSLGQSGALPPLIAAWAANAIYALLGVVLFLWSE